jgi:hypothetical protein
MATVLWCRGNGTEKPICKDDGKAENDANKVLMAEINRQIQS